MTLTLFSRSQEGSDCWKMNYLQPISRMNGWNLTKLVQLYCWDRDNNWLDFGDLDPNFKVTLGLRFWKMAPQRPHTCKKKREIIETTFFNNRSVQTGGWHTFSSENTVLVLMLISQTHEFLINLRAFQKLSQNPLKYKTRIKWEYYVVVVFS